MEHVCGTVSGTVTFCFFIPWSQQKKRRSSLRIPLSSPPPLRIVCLQVQLASRSSSLLRSALRSPGRTMYASPSFVGHSLWLVPREPTRSTFQSVISRLSAEKNTANFGAHVTLIAGVEPEGGVAEVISKAERLASELKPISARVERTACKDLYFQSVFALLARDKALIDAHNAARVAFGQDPTDGSDYMPHVSLLYGDLPMSTREAIREDTEPDLINKEFELDCVQVWCTKGVVSEWKLVGTFNFQQT